MVISLGAPSPTPSCGLIRRGNSKSPKQPKLPHRHQITRRATVLSASTRPCSQWGLPGTLVPKRPVRSYRTISPLPGRNAAWRYVSVALSVGSPRPAVSRHRRPMESGLSSDASGHQPTAQRPPVELLPSGHYTSRREPPASPRRFGENRRLCGERAAAKR